MLANDVDPPRGPGHEAGLVTKILAELGEQAVPSWRLCKSSAGRVDVCERARHRNWPRHCGVCLCVCVYVCLLFVSATVSERKSPSLFLCFLSPLPVVNSTLQQAGAFPLCFCSLRFGPEHRRKCVHVCMLRAREDGRAKSLAMFHARAPVLFPSAASYPAKATKPVSCETIFFCWFVGLACPF